MTLCAKCGHDILDHRKIDVVGPAPCDHVFDRIPEWPVLCNCPNFEEPKPKLCVCGHPATSHAPTATDRYADFGAPGVVIRFNGLCREAHPNGPCPCWGFTAPEDAKQKTATETVADQPEQREWIGGVYPYEKSEWRDECLAMKAKLEACEKARDLNADRAIEHCNRADERADRFKFERDGAVERAHMLLEAKNRSLDREIALAAKVKELEAWKKEAISVMPDLQAIGKELGLEIGDTVHDKILPALKKRRVLIERQNALIEAFRCRGCQL